MKRVAVCLSIISALCVCPTGSACGDKLVQIGRGVRYQRANSVRPASIMMLVGPHFDRKAVNRLRSDLSFVGHKVQIVADRSAFASTLASKHFDIVLVDVDNLAAATEHVDAMTTRPTVIPMIDRSANAAPAEIERRFPFVMLLSSRAFDHAAVINRAMK